MIAGVANKRRGDNRTISPYCIGTLTRPTYDIRILSDDRSSETGIRFLLLLLGQLIVFNLKISVCSVEYSVLRTCIPGSVYGVVSVGTISMDSTESNANLTDRDPPHRKVKPGTAGKVVAPILMGVGVKSPLCEYAPECAAGYLRRIFHQNSPAGSIDCCLKG